MSLMEWLLRPFTEKIMASLEEIKSKMNELVAAAAANADATQAVVGYVDGLKAQLNDIQSQLAEALANQADPAALQAVSDQLSATIDSINADAVAEAAITGTSEE